ncbi:MAG TPA: protein kinase, partial [Planctomycetota bacterium]|nr:protein kinase [Planctomycetota bacterium]
QKTALKEGDMILERYRVQKLLGKGGMGIVYQVFDCSLNYSVAFKMLFIQQDISQQELEVAFQRFQLEARSMAQIKHPNVLAIHDIGEYLGMPYYTMDLINGKELSEYTGVDIFEREMVTIQQIMEWAYTLCTAIQYVHDQGIIHRDLKPSNVMITEDRGPILMDFGIARIENYKADLTVEGQSLGTPAYMAPEQALGRKKEINNRTDVYGIGAILYETLTGTAPYSGNPMQVMFKVISPTNFPIPIKERNEKVTSDVITIVEKAMSKEQSARYKSAGEMAEDIKRYLDGYRIYAKPPTRLEKCKYYFKHRAKSTIITASLLLIIFFVSIFLFIKQTQEEKERKEKIASLSKQATEQLMVLQDLDNTQNIEARNRSSESKKYLPIFFDIIRLYDEILRLNPNNLAIKQARLNIFLQLGEYTTQIKNFEVASSIYNSAIEYANQNNLRTVNLDQLREECNSLTMRHETETNKQLGLIFQKIDQLATTSTNKNNETNKEKKE